MLSSAPEELTRTRLRRLGEGIGKVVYASEHWVVKRERSATAVIALIVMWKFLRRIERHVPGVNTRLVEHPSRQIRFLRVLTQGLVAIVPRPVWFMTHISNTRAPGSVGVARARTEAHTARYRVRPYGQGIVVEEGRPRRAGRQHPQGHRAASARLSARHRAHGGCWVRHWCSSPARTDPKRSRPPRRPLARRLRRLELRRVGARARPTSARTLAASTATPTASSTSTRSTRLDAATGRRSASSSTTEGVDASDYKISLPSGTCSTRRPGAAVSRRARRSPAGRPTTPTPTPRSSRRPRRHPLP